VTTDKNENDIETLRNHLFATLADLRAKENPMDIERARAVAEVAGKIIETAKVEVQAMKEIGGRGTGFIPESPKVKQIGHKRD